MDAPVSAKAALLQALSSGPGIAYELAGRVREATGGAVDLSEGSLYPALRALEKAGAVESSEEPPLAPNAKPRRVYRLTSAGAAEAARQREVLAALTALGDGHRCGMPTTTPAERWVVKDGEDVEEGDQFEPT